MPILTTGAIKSMKVPEQFSEHAEQVGGYGPEHWSHSYRFPKQRFPEITFRYSGFPVQESAAASFRSALAEGARTIYDINDAAAMTEANKKIVAQLSGILGNSGDNQVSNTQTGIDGPVFELEEMEVIVVQNRPVLRVKGYFRNLQSMEAHTYMHGIFIDASPKSKECKVEELYLQAFPQDAFRRHLPDFAEVLSSIAWSN